MKKYLKEIAILVVAIFIISNVISYIRSPDIKDIDVSSLITKESKKPLLIYFWTSWCSVCKLQSPNIETISKYYDVLTILVDDVDIDKIKKDFDFKILHDKDGLIAKKFKVNVFPTIFIVDSNSKIRFSEVGYSSTFGLLFRLWWVD